MSRLTGYASVTARQSEDGSINLSYLRIDRPSNRMVVEHLGDCLGDLTTPVEQAHILSYATELLLMRRYQDRAPQVAPQEG